MTRSGGACPRQGVRSPAALPGSAGQAAAPAGRRGLGRRQRERRGPGRRAAGMPGRPCRTVEAMRLLPDSRGQAGPPQLSCAGSGAYGSVIGVDRALRPEVRSPAAGLKARSRPLRPPGGAGRPAAAPAVWTGPLRPGVGSPAARSEKRAGTPRAGERGLGPTAGATPRPGLCMAGSTRLPRGKARGGSAHLPGGKARGRIRSPTSRQGAPRRSAARGRPAYGTVSGTGGPAATLGDTGRAAATRSAARGRAGLRHRQRHRRACRHARRHGPSSRHTLGGTRPGRPTAPSAAQAGLPPRSATRGRAAATRSPAAARSKTRTLHRRDGDARRAAARWAARRGPTLRRRACGSVSGSRICGPPSRGSGPGAARHCPRAPSAARTSTRAAPTGRPGGRRGPV
ncbi:hypothetical protein RKD30_001776 [Streptomyces pristinaespiralis]